MSRTRRKEERRPREANGLPPATCSTKSLSAKNAHTHRCVSVMTEKGISKLNRFVSVPTPSKKRITTYPLSIALRKSGQSKVTSCDYFPVLSIKGVLLFLRCLPLPKREEQPAATLRLNANNTRVRVLC